MTNQRGRPPIANPQRRRQFRATDNDWRRWKSHANSQGIALSRWIRNSLNETLNRTVKRTR